MVRKKNINKNWLVFLSTFPPRECGIGTFTNDLVHYIDQTFTPSIETKVVALNTTETDVYNYPSKVVFQISQDNPDDYERAANFINRRPYIHCVNIQHEFGIYGGDYGSYVLKFLEKVEKPKIITFHTVLPSPGPELIRIVQRLSQLCQAIIVLTDSSREILVREYGISSDKIYCIPHGIHPVPFKTSNEGKRSLRMGKRAVLTTFGLLSRNKGIEYVLRALPKVIKKYPEVLYLVVGETHPTVRRQEGEAYRNSLMTLVRKLNLSKNVRFYDKYFSIRDILDFLQATDIYLATSLDPNQTVSGTLSYALGTGRCVISTRFSQANEIIKDTEGMLVDFKKPTDYSRSIMNLLNNEELRETMQKNAYVSTRHMTWNNVAIAYMNVFGQFAKELKREEKKLPPINIKHIKRMSDDFGMLQFANLSKPDPNSGYTLDDNARGLMAMCEYYRQFKVKSIFTVLQTYLHYIEYCQQEDGLFINYVNFDKSPNAERNTKENLDDANARALLALAIAATHPDLPVSFRKKAVMLWWKRWRNPKEFVSPRSIAFALKSLFYLLNQKPNQELMARVYEYSDKLVELYAVAHRKDWQWFETELTYSNGLLPEALFLAYRLTEKIEYFEIAKRTLDFLMETSFRGPVLVPIGQEKWYTYKGYRSEFDQQPEEVYAMVKALSVAYQITKDPQYYEKMLQAFYWFLGNNLLGQVVYNYTTGGCCDGLTKNGLNLDQGAESTLAYFLSRLEINVQSS